jgi:hypothetical protein
MRRWVFACMRRSVLIRAGAKPGWVRKLVALGSVAVAAGGYVVTSPTGIQAASAAATSAVSMLVQNDSDGLLWAVNPDGSTYRIGNGLGIQSGTNVAMAPMASGGFAAAWNGGGGQLFTIGQDNVGHNTGYMMPAGFTPAIAQITPNRAEVIYQKASDGLLWAVDPDGSTRRLGNGLGIAPGTTPAVAPLSGGSFEVAWNGGGGQLWTLGADNTGRDTGQMMVPGSSPAIAELSTGGAEIIYQKASDGLLWAVNPDGSTYRIGNGLGLAAGTIPAVTGLPDGSFEVAWNGGGGQLWTLGADNTGRSTGQVMDPGTSPAIATQADGTQIAFRRADDGALVTLGPDGTPQPGGLTIKAGSQPAVATWSTGITDQAGMCLDVSGGNNANGTPVQLWWCNGSAAQQWTTEPDGTIHALGKCLDVTGGNVVAGTRVQLWDCNGTPAQTWGRNNQGFINPLSGTCLDATGGSTAAGTPMRIWSCNGTAAQQWTLPQGSAVPFFNPSTSSNTATAVADGTVNVVVPKITCTLTVEDPELDTAPGMDEYFVRALGHTQCDFPVLHLRQWHQLLWLRPAEIVPRVADSESDISSDNQTAATEPAYPCHAGRWTSAAEDVVFWPIGFTPRVSIILVPNPDPLDLVQRQCLTSQVGTPLKTAEARIQDEGFTVGTVTMRESDAPFDNVIAQSLESDGQTVDFVASGGEGVPDLVNDAESYAAGEIGEDGFVLGNEYDRDDCRSPGDVEDQSPEPGTFAAPGTSIDITVSTCSTIPK